MALSNVLLFPAITLLCRLILRAVVLHASQARFVLGRWDSQTALNYEVESRAPAVLQALQHLKESKVSLAVQPMRSTWNDEHMFQSDRGAPLERVSEETEVH